VNSTRFLISLFLLTSVAMAQPRLFFSDLESGPNTGGENDGGVYVTIWGKGFGAQRGEGSVSAGGGRASRYASWSDDKITFQLGAAARSGGIVVQTPAGASNELPFRVRPGGIYFVSNEGNDSNDGSFSRPWRTLIKAKNTMRPGDTTYAMNGVSQTSEERFSAAISIEDGGTPGNPIALAAYPGATVTIGSDRLLMGLRIPNIDTAGDADHWVLSQIVFRATETALAIEGPSPLDWRITGNNISCSVGEGLSGCVGASSATNLKFLGNEVHNVSRPGTSKLNHAVYFTTNSNQIEAGWNYLHDNHTCRAIQFHSTNGRNQYDLSVHDNRIIGSICDAINFATVDPSRGKVEAYNNVILRAGMGPHPRDGSSNYSCIYVAGITNTGADGSGVVELYHNTCYDFGAADPGGPDSGAFVRGSGSPGLTVNLRNNLTLARGGQKYLSGDSARFRGSNNLWFGAGPAPAALTANLNADPRLANAASGDLRPEAGSPAIDAGGFTGVLTDIEGVLRAQGSAPDLGAYEFRQSLESPSRPAIAAVRGAFSELAGPVSPGEIVNLHGAALGPVEAVRTSLDRSTGLLPTTVSGVSVTVGGTPAPLFLISATRITMQIPYEVAGRQTAEVVVTVGSESSPPQRLPVQPARPSLFPTILHLDLSVVSAENPISSGGLFLLYATGFGLTTPPGVSGAPEAGSSAMPESALELQVADRRAEILYALRPAGTVGLLQIAAFLPADLAAQTSQPVTLRAGESQSQPGVLIAVR